MADADDVKKSKYMLKAKAAMMGVSIKPLPQAFFKVMRGGGTERHKSSWDREVFKKLYISLKNMCRPPVPSEQFEYIVDDVRGALTGAVMINGSGKVGGFVVWSKFDPWSIGDVYVTNLEYSDGDPGAGWPADPNSEQNKGQRAVEFIEGRLQSNVEDGRCAEIKLVCTTGREASNATTAAPRGAGRLLMCYALWDIYRRTSAGQRRFGSVVLDIADQHGDSRSRNHYRQRIRRNQTYKL